MPDLPGFVQLEVSEYQLQLGVGVSTGSDSDRVASQGSRWSEYHPVATAPGTDLIGQVGTGKIGHCRLLTSLSLTRLFYGRGNFLKIVATELLSAALTL